MALQGTIDAFALTEVLALLSASSKSGRLLLEGDRGCRELWIDRGLVVGGSEGPPDAPRMVFEMLRFDLGSFAFDAVDREPPTGYEPVALEECVRAAAALLEEWRRIERIVPTPRHRVGLTPVLAAPSVTVSDEDWVVLASVGDVPEVTQVAQRVDLDEVACTAVVADLVERSLLTVHEPLLPDGPEVLAPGARVTTVTTVGVADAPQDVLASAGQFDEVEPASRQDRAPVAIGGSV